MWKPGEAAGKGGFEFCRNVKVPQRKVALSLPLFWLGGFPQNRLQKEVGTLILSFLLEDLDVETR